MISLDPAIAHELHIDGWLYRFAIALWHRGVVAVAPLTDALSLFQTLLPSEHFDGLRHRGTLRENNRVYNAAVVMWLTISQRMRAGTMATSVLELIRGLPSSFWPLPCKRLQAGPDGRRKKLSENPTSYHDALQTLPVRVVELSFDQAFAGMMTEAKGKLPEVGEVFCRRYVGPHGA